MTYAQLHTVKEEHGVERERRRRSGVMRADGCMKVERGYAVEPVPVEIGSPSAWTVVVVGKQLQETNVGTRPYARVVG